jgi:hypothetical protein
MPTGKTPETGARPPLQDNDVLVLQDNDVLAATSKVWAMSSEDIQGDEWAA